MGYLIQQILPGGAFVFLLTFSRIGSLFMALPAFGEAYVSTNVRLALGLSVSLAALAMTAPLMPNPPSSPWQLMMMTASEAGIGIFIGFCARLFTTALSTAGMVIGMQSGLSFAQFFDPAQGSQSALVSAFMSIFGIMFVFASDLHLMLIRAVFDSYTLFPPTKVWPFGDFAQLAARTLDQTWALGIQLSAPFIVYGVVFTVGVGVLNRLMPNVQVTYVSQPLQILGSFFVMGATLAAVGILFLDRFETFMSQFLVK